MNLDRVSGPADTVQLVDEIHGPGRLAEPAVGRGLQPDIFLHRHHVRGGGILGLP
jgi:hypothetical protein